MCSNSCECDPVAKEIEENLSSAQSAQKLCRKCKSDPFIILDRVHLECKRCFLESCNKKLRSTIGKSKLVRNNDSILIAYSGGPSSCALLDLMWNSVQSHMRREQKFRPSILHIDMQSLTSKSDPRPVTREERCSNLLTLINHLANSYPGWPIYWSTLESSFSNLNDETIFSKFVAEDVIDSNHYLLNSTESQLRLNESLNQITDLTDRQQYLTNHMEKFINRLAASINESLTCKKDEEPLKFVFMASNATQLANNLLVDVILGRGSEVCSTVSVCDRRLGVPVMRPMRDFSKKEIAFYLRAKSLEVQVVPNSLLTMKPPKSSVQTLTENFLSKLYVDYPSTYSTLLRTGDKMQDCKARKISQEAQRAKEEACD